jgi:hypothetical protein
MDKQPKFEVIKVSSIDEETLRELDQFLKKLVERGLTIEAISTTNGVLVKIKKPKK